MNLNYEKAKNKLLASQLDGCRQFFVANKFFVEAGYCCILEDDLAEAEEYFARVAENNLRARWGLFLCGVFKEKICDYPTYFQIRNFLEVDFNILLRYFKGNYAETLLKYSDWLSSINSEVFKYFARAFLKNGYEKEGFYFLTRAEDKFYNDPELHFLFAEYYNSKNDLKNTEKYIKKCLSILPNYYPARKLAKNT